MSDTTIVEQQLDTLQRQAKRLAGRLGLPITHAKDLLAKALYRCASWQDLQGRVRHQRAERHVLMLAALPRAEESLAYLTEHRRGLANALSQHMLTNANLAGLLEHIQAVFAVESESITLDDLVPALDVSWRPAGIGPDPRAVLEAEVCVNGACLRLLATRAYLPGHYDFGSKHQNGEYAEPFGGKLRVVWSDPDAWFQAALQYLEDDDAEQVILPVTELNDEMAQHQAWFEAALATNRHIAEYRGGDNDLVPLILDGKDCYVVFGVPVAREDLDESSEGVDLGLSSREDNFSQLVVANNAPFCVEWIAYEPVSKRHPGEFEEYFDELRTSLLKGDRLPVVPRKDGQPGTLFLRPATFFDIQQELKVDFTRLDDEVALVLKTSNLQLARELLSKVAIRDLMVYEREGRSRYFALFKLESRDETPDLSVSLEYKAPEWTTMSNLVRASYWKHLDGGSELLAEVAPELLTLVDLLGKRTVDAALAHGLIQRVSVTFAAEIEKQPARCKHLQPVSEEVAEVLEEPLRADGRISIGRAQYFRDNF